MKNHLYLIFALSFQCVSAQRCSRVHLDISKTEDLSRLENASCTGCCHWKLEVGEVVIEVNDFELGLLQQVDIPTI